ncbi:hypothetical protein [Pseudaminobacter sp. NGMCC 1.201702]|uniref:hypothetical protein n=1 Tax=Pseudaminobacter sp. NGMCC 1.201702 TaxID=3391825 RepID=UPI0039EED072
MKKPVIRKEPVRLAVVAPDARKQHDTNPVDTGIGVEASTVRPEPLSSTRAARILAPTVRPRKATASLPLLMLLGHRESCATLRRAGAIASCDCRTKPMEDPAVAVGLAVHFARISLAQRVALPEVIIELLARRVEEGDAACMMVAEWLETAGLLKLRPLPASAKKRGNR